MPNDPVDPPTPARVSTAEISQRLHATKLRFSASHDQIRDAVRRLDAVPHGPIATLPDELRTSLTALTPATKRFHGAKVALSWFPFALVRSPCADKFGYLTPPAVRTPSMLPFDVTSQALLGQLGALMADPLRPPGADSTIPAGYTYFGQFVDHDITLDVSSSLDKPTDATKINNMRTPALDLDSLYGRGPGLDPYLYVFPATGPTTAIKLQTGANTNTGPGGPGGAAGFGGMIVQTGFDLPRVVNPLTPALSTNTAIIGDPRNDENLIVSQFHHAMLRFHNRVVDLLVLAAFAGDIFAEAKKIVTQHYQWAVVNDYLKKVCGPGAVASALAGVTAAIGSPFSMPVEFSVAAYRFGHSMIRPNYWINFVQINATLADVFEFIRPPRLPVFSNWVVDWNAFFDPGFPVPVHNKAKKIDSTLAAGLNTLPGLSGAIAALATRNLRRGLAMGLPSGQAMAAHLGVPAMTAAQLTTGLPANEVAVLNQNGGLLLTKTPLWYYCLREASVLSNGDALGPVGAKIVADTFVRMLKRDAASYLNVPGFTPFLMSTVPGDFTVADLVTFAGVTEP